MNTAFALKSDCFAPLRQIFASLWPIPVLQTPGLPELPPADRRKTPDFIASSQAITRARAIYHPNRKPLRVVRVLESGQPRSDVGRMVISGRMADVCAELDRLAACEAA
jgi:hypothetical protein